MKKYTLDEFQGFPFALNELQNLNVANFSLASALVGMATRAMRSNLILLSGCELTETQTTTQISAGVAILDGELAIIQAAELIGSLDYSDLWISKNTSQNEEILWGDGVARTSIIQEAYKVSTALAGIQMSTLVHYRYSAELDGDILSSAQIDPPLLTRIGSMVYLSGRANFNVGASVFRLSLSGEDAQNFKPKGVSLGASSFYTEIRAEAYNADANTWVEVRIYWYDLDNELRIDFTNASDSESHLLNGISFESDL